MTGIAVLFVYNRPEDGVQVSKPGLLPSIPSVGDRMIPPGERESLTVVRKIWDASRGNGDNAIVHIALD